MYNFATKKQYEFYESDKTKALKFTVVSHFNSETHAISDFRHRIHPNSISRLCVLGRLKENNDSSLRAHKSLLFTSWPDHLGAHKVSDPGWTLGSYPVLI